MKEIALYAFWAITGSALFTGWFLRLTNNHYRKGYADGYKRGRLVASERLVD